MSKKFKVTFDDDQDRDLREIAEAAGFTPAQLIGGAITDRLLRTPVEVEEESA